MKKFNLGRTVNTFMAKVPSNKVTQAADKGLRTVKKNSPLILNVIGGAGLVATAYFAYKSAPKVEEIVDDMEENRAYEERYYELMKIGSRNATDEEVIELHEITERFDGAPVFNRYEYARRFLGAIALPVATAVVSLSAFGFAYRIMNTRLNGLASAVAGLAADRIETDRRMKEVLSEEDYNKVNSPAKMGDIEFVDENGEKKVIKGAVERREKMLNGVWFSDSDEYVRGDNAYNQQWIDNAERKCLDILFRRGALLMNQVRDELGLERTAEGMVMGWTSGDAFSFDKLFVDTCDAEGVPYRDVFIGWVMPKYIYDDVDLEGRYSVLGEQ